MPRASIIQTNFTGGELAPEIALGRVDIAKYNNGARRIENCLLSVQGGAKRRPGTRYIAPTKTQSKKARLIEFIYNRGQAYVLEMGEEYIRFFQGHAQIAPGGVPYEIISPYVESQLFSINYVQKADTAFFVHEGVMPQRMQRFSNINWGIGIVPFITPPIEEIGIFPNTDLTLFTVEPVATTATASSAVFLKSDVGRTIAGGGGFATITAVTSSTQISLNITSRFKTTVQSAGLWNLGKSPQDAIAPSGEGVAGGLISLNANFTYNDSQVTISAWVTGFGSAAVTATAHGYSTGDSVTITGTTVIDGTFVVEVLNANQFVFAGNFLPGGGGVSGIAQKVIVSTDSEVWRADDVGQWVEINGGLVKIEAFINSTTVNAKVIRPLASKLPAGVNEWRLLREAWGVGLFGYPRAVTISKQRLLFAGSPQYPQNLWGSVIQEYLNFETGTNDDQGFTFELDGPRNSPIMHLAPTRQLLVLTEADEMSVKGGQEKPITPTNIQKTDESTAGASGVRPVKVGNELLFVQAAGLKVNAAAYRFDFDGFLSPDRTVFARHITESGIVQLAHQKEPDSTVFAVRNDGQIAACAYDVEQEVVGWSRWVTQGKYESVATIPTPTAEDTFTIVQRTIGGVTKRYVEVFDPEVLLDCAVVGNNPAGQATWGGLDHLEGETVQAWADGSYMGEFVVDAGEITLPRDAIDVQIGLGFTCLIETLQPEMGGNGTTAQGDPVHVNEVILRVLDTQAAVINGEPIEFRRFGPNLLDQPPPIYTGDVRGVKLSDEIYRTQQVITQPYPMPFHLLDIIRRVTINGG